MSEPKKISQYFDDHEIPYKREPLTYGDYIIIGQLQNIVIERKDIFDLFASVKDGRLWEQLTGLQQYEGYKKMLFIEGSVAKVMSTWKWITYPQYIGILGSALAGWNISMVMTPNIETTLLLINYLNKKIDGANTAEFVKPGIKKADRTMDDVQLDVLMAFDGIGGKKAVELVEKFKSLKTVFSSTKAKLAAIVGDKNAANILDIVRYKREK